MIQGGGEISLAEIHKRKETIIVQAHKEGDKNGCNYTAKKNASKVRQNISCP
jgi:hypothetical protein